MKKLITLAATLVFVLAFSITAGATDLSPEVLGEQFTNPNAEKKQAQVLGESWEAGDGDENSAVSPKTADAGIVVYIAAIGAVMVLAGAKTKKRA